MPDLILIPTVQQHGGWTDVFDARDSAATDALTEFNTRFTDYSSTPTQSFSQGWDAFRHMYVSGRLIQMGYSKDFVHFLGTARELPQIISSPNDANMDRYNNELGRGLGETTISSTVLAQAVEDMVRDETAIINKNSDPRLYEGEEINVVDIESLEASDHDTDFSVTKVDAGAALDGVDANFIKDDIVTFSATSDATGQFSVIRKGSTAVVDNEEYVITKIVDAIETGAEALTTFISDQVSDVAEWFNNSQGAQLDFANWFAQNVGALVDGSLEADDAFIDFAIYFAEQRLGEVVTNAINLDEAHGLVESTLESMGIGGDQAALLSSSFAATFARIGVEFVTSGGEWDDGTMANIAVAATTSVVASHYAKNYFGSSYGPNTLDVQVEVGAAVAAATTLAIGLFNSGDFTQADWILLGVNTGIAAAAAYGGGQAAIALVGTAGGPVGIVAGAILGVVASSLISSIYKGATFGPGEYGSPSAALDTQYQVIELEVDKVWHKISPFIVLLI